MNSFYDRLVFVLGDNDKHPWGDRLGISPTKISNMFRGEGHIPNHESLALIRRVENVSITWLITGDGAPYVVSRCQLDAEACELLRQHLKDEPNWAIHIAACEPDFTVVLSQPCRIKSGERDIEYFCIEIISGAGPDTLHVAFEARQKHPVFLLRLRRAEFQRLSTGWMGNMELFGWRHTPSLLDQASPLVDTAPIFALPHVAEPRAVYGLPTDERELLDVYRELPEAKKKAVLTLLKK